MRAIRNLSKHAEWLSMVEIAGPFLAISVLEKIFPQGLDAVASSRYRLLRSAYEEWQDAIDENDPLLTRIHQEWIRLVLVEILEFDNTVLFPFDRKMTEFVYQSPGQSETFAPDLFLRSGNGNVSLLISIQPPGTDLEKVKIGDRWPASIIERMTLLCRFSGVRLGLITNGERWMIVNAPVGNISGHVSWYSRLWFQEPITFKAFQSLLGLRRWFGPQDETLQSMLEESLQYHEEITDTLGEQVRRAVEVLVQCLDKADQDRNRTLLNDVKASELYEAGLTVMMRLVFILCAEERELLLLGDPIYDQYYAVTNLRSQLAEEADRHGPEILERRHDAWSRLLAVFRAIYGGIEHETLRMPALGGSLFDPDRFSFLEGRPKGTQWDKVNAKPLPIDNRTVLLLLNALQILEQRGSALLLSYRSLDVEQIGHVYEGLLEYTVQRLPEVTLRLECSQKAKNPNLTLSQIESARIEGESALVQLIKETTQRSESAITNDLRKNVDDETFGKIVVVCNGNLELANRIRPFSHLLQTDAWGDFIVYPANSFAITLGADRRETGTHYTPKLLTESIVEKTLEPIAYIGPAEGRPSAEWKLKSSSELLDIKVCDPTMGSGAFLVQVCRWLAERLVDAWRKEEDAGKFITVDGIVLDNSDGSESMPKSLDDRILISRRLVAEKCLYGVDLNPLAVELAKLSIWLVTLAKNRPFGFLDHNLRHGDSLLGIHRLDQLTKLSMTPEKDQGQLRIFGQNIEKSVCEIIEIRKRLREIPIRDIRDVQAMIKLDKEARQKIANIETIADALISEALRLSQNPRALEAALDSLAILADDSFDEITERSKHILSKNLTKDGSSQKVFHWPLEFPEVFIRGGFDAIVGNPPFMGGRRMRGALGDNIINWLLLLWPHASINADLCSFFFLRSEYLIRDNGTFGLLSTNTIGQGDTARTGLVFLINEKNCNIRFANSSFKWPGSATVIAALLIIQKGSWLGEKILNGKPTKIISPVLDDEEGWGEAQRLSENIEINFQGSVLAGMGFVLSSEEAHEYLFKKQENAVVLFPYLGGDDVNSHPEQKASRWAIDFRDKSLDECSKRWPELFDRVKNLVKPERDQARRKAHKIYWWHHGDKRPALYERIKQSEEIFVITRHTKYVAFIKVCSKQVFQESLCVLDLPSWGSFALLQCSFHDAWVRRGSSTVGETLRYTPSDYFDTYPFLHLQHEILNPIGERYHEHRKKIMQAQQEGLTATYNRFHNPSETTKDIHVLRDLQVEMDKATAYAYDWKDLNLGHDYYDTKQGIRFTISEETRRDVFQRLLELNHRLYQEETQTKFCKIKGSGNIHKINHPDLFDVTDHNQ